MDYEKEYNEALERAQRILCNLPEGSTTIRDIESIFPELAGSENERVRKEIVSIVKAYRENCIDEGTHRFDDCLSWLEKQKEPDKCPEYCVRSHCMGCSIYEKQKEQKPAWSEEDKQCFDEAIEALESLGFDGEASNLKSLRDYRKPLNTWKPAWWNKEDELKRNNLIGLVEEIKRQPLKRLEDWDGYVNWLKSLPERFSPQPKPEWSEEDEHRRQQAINALDRNGYYVLVDWLKSLRPQWRPSEEQIGALSWMLENARGNIDFDPLKNLYEQLKRLMED